MSWPDIAFTEEDKINFQKMALKLERRMAIDSKNFKDLERFSQYPPLIEAIRLAKEKKSTSHSMSPIQIIGSLRLISKNGHEV